MSKPTFLDHNPVRGFIGTQLNDPVFFRVQDIHGVDVDSLNVSILGTNAIIGGVFQTGFEGIITKENAIPNSVSVLVYRISPFSYCQIVNVLLQIDDLQGETGEDNYDFITIPQPFAETPLVSADPVGGIFTAPFDVGLVSSDVAAYIRYTIDGTLPNLYSPIYVEELNIVNEGLTTLKFIAILPDTYSNVITENYTIDSIAPVSSAKPSGGSFFSSQEVELSVDDPKAIIYYTTNGLEPTLQSNVYSTPIIVRDNKITVIKFFAVDEAGNKEITHVETYNIEIAKNNFLPTNVFVTCPFNQSELYIRWDDMYPIYNQIIGYNVYRADVEMGPYQKLNTDIISITQYTDKTLDTQIINEDVSEQFRRTVSISRDIDDSFNSTGPFDESKWLEIDVAQLLFQYNGVIFKDSTGLRQLSRLVSKFKLQGDFEIKVKFDLYKWIVPDLGKQFCKFLVRKDEYNSIEISRCLSNTVSSYCGQRYINGNPGVPFVVPTNQDFGEFKIVRVNDIVTTYFYDNVLSAFVELAAYNDCLDDVNVEFAFRSEDKQIEVQFTNFVLVTGNPVLIEPLNPRKEYLIYLSQRPVVDDTGNNNPTDKSEFVNVTIDGQRAYIRLLQGIEGVIELETERVYDEVKKQYFEPPVPNEFSAVLVTYRVPSHTTNVRLMKNYFYKVSCVTSEDETDLDLVRPQTLQPDKMTYMFEEAVRRNAWLLEQGGERVLLYIKKRAGIKCHCTYRDLKERTHKQPDQDCEVCFGSGFVGGFDGPFPIIIGPLTTEKRIQQTDRGLKLAYQIETWIGPTPVVSQRDMVIRRNGDRCLVGPLTPVEGPGGVRVQQHFVVEILDSTDIRYKFLVVLPGQKVQPGVDKSSKHVLVGGPNVATIDSPKEREELYTSEENISHQNINVDHVVKGRSITFESIEY